MRMAVRIQATKTLNIVSCNCAAFTDSVQLPSLVLTHFSPRYQPYPLAFHWGDPPRGPECLFVLALLGAGFWRIHPG